MEPGPGDMRVCDDISGQGILPSPALTVPGVYEADPKSLETP